MANSKLSKNHNVIDGLVFYSDGSTRDMRAGGVHAINVTITDMQSDFEDAINDAVTWRKRCKDPKSGWHLITQVEDVQIAKENNKLGLIMGWQNARPLGNKLQRIATFHELGIRVIQLTYNEANLIGDGCLEQRNAGLSSFGIEAVHELNKTGIAIDISHCSRQTCLDACSVSSKPVLLTHANPSAVIKRPRNKDDEVIKAVAKTGGVIGCSIHAYLSWRGNPNMQPLLGDFVDCVKHIGNLVGWEHVGIGTDFPSVDTYQAVEHVMVMSRTKYAASGGDFSDAFGDVMEARYPKETPTPKEFPVLLEALESGGLTTDQIEKIAGNNFLRAFNTCWSI